MNSLPEQGTSKTAGNTSPSDVVRRFLDLLATGDVDAAVDLLGADVHYINVPLPPMRGRERVRRAFKAATRFSGSAFEVYIHTLASEGNTVLTERTDVLIWGPLRVQLWVCGRFDVQEGRIALWKDYFDWAYFTVAVVRGLVGIVLPSVRAKPPVAV